MAYKQIKKYGFRDSLEKGDPEKVIYGVDFDAEFEAIEQAFDGVPGVGGDPIAPETPGFEDVVFQTRTEPQKVVSEFSFEQAGDSPLTMKNTGMYAGTAYIRYTGVTWEVDPSLSVTGDITAGGDLTVEGTTQLNGDLAVDGNIDATGNISMDGNLAVGGHVEGDLTVNGNIIIDGGSIVDPDGNSQGGLWTLEADGSISRDSAIAVINDSNTDSSLVITDQHIYSTFSNFPGLMFTEDGPRPVIVPVKAENVSGNTINSDDIDLGASWSKFRNAHFSGTVNAGDIIASGNVGVGTNSPERPLHIQSSLTAMLARLEGVGRNSRLLFAIDGDDLWNVGATSDDRFSFVNGASKNVLDLNQEGNVGIGMSPLRSTAKEQLAEWKSRFDARLKAEPKADKKAVTLEITDDAFEVLPTEDKLAEWMETRAAGDRLQVQGNATFSGTVSAGAVQSNASGWAVQLQDGNALDFSRDALNYIRCSGASSGLMIETGGAETLRLLNNQNAAFKGTVDAAGFTVNGQPIGGGYDGSDAVKLSGNQEVGGIKTFTSDIRCKANVYAYYGSDERLKDDIAPMPVGLIDAIDPSTWKWKEDGRSSGGVIAQQLQEIGLDDWVREAPNGDLGVDYNALIGMLIAEVQDLKKKLSDG